MQRITVLFLFLTPIHCTNNQFPDDFLFGVASSAYQIEGGHDAKGKGENIWDYYLRHNPALIRDLSNGNIACDSYNKIEEDIALLEELGVDFYRFSISWSRIMPTGYPNQINPDGIRYYNKLIDGLLAKNIRPMVTMYHWDLPKPLQDLGGWTNSILADIFQDYAQILFENFGDRVKLWITFNSNLLGYGDAEWPPQINQSGIAEYLFIKNTLLAHAQVYHLYDREFRRSQQGQVGITIDGRWFESGSEALRDQEAVDRALQFFFGTIANPIFGSGDFPEIVKERVDQLSRNEGFFRSRLPKLSPDQVDYVKGTYDFLGLNIYTAFLVKDAEVMDAASPSFEKDMKVVITQDPQWPKSNADWIKVVPWALRKVLHWVKTSYGDFPIYITENGFSDSGEIDDVGRINYYELYLRALLEAIHEDKVQVKGYAAWSLLDNFEWLSGFSEKFGLYHVDFSDPSRKRTPKSSAKWYKNLIKYRKLNETVKLKTEL